MFVIFAKGVRIERNGLCVTFTDADGSVSASFDNEELADMAFWSLVALVENNLQGGKKTG